MTLPLTTCRHDELPTIHTTLSLAPLKNARLIWHNDALAGQLAIFAALFDIPAGADVRGGELLPPGTPSLIQACSGHQSDIRADQFDDGRGILLGE